MRYFLLLLVLCVAFVFELGKFTHFYTLNWRFCFVCYSGRMAASASWRIGYVPAIVFLVGLLSLCQAADVLSPDRITSTQIGKTQQPAVDVQDTLRVNQGLKTEPLSVVKDSDAPVDSEAQTILLVDDETKVLDTLAGDKVEDSSKSNLEPKSPALDLVTKAAESSVSPTSDVEEDTITESSDDENLDITSDKPSSASNAPAPLDKSTVEKQSPADDEAKHTSVAVEKQSPVTMEEEEEEISSSDTEAPLPSATSTSLPITVRDSDVPATNDGPTSSSPISMKDEVNSGDNKSSDNTRDADQLSVDHVTDPDTDADQTQQSETHAENDPIQNVEGAQGRSADFAFDFVSSRQARVDDFITIGEQDLLQQTGE